MKHLIPTLFLLAASPVQAEIVLDGSLGPAGELPGPDYQISADLGQQSGANLFHSFTTFDLYQGQTATFSGPSSVANIISRVTGGSVSWIDGPLSSDIHGADLYFLNPAGVIFGPNGSLDLSGSFHLSTANYLELGQDGLFYSDLGAESSLAMAPPSAFGFLGDTPAPIEVQGDGSTLLMVDEGEALTLNGGDLTVNNASLFAPGGTLTLASFSGAGQVNVPGHDQEFSASGMHFGTVQFGRDTESHWFNPTIGGTVADLDVSPLAGQKSGDIFIQAGELIWTDSELQGITLDEAGGDVVVNVSSMEMSSNSQIEISSYGQAGAGNLLLTSGAVSIDDSIIASRALAGGSGGEVHIVANSLIMASDSSIDVSTYDAGDAGSINIEAASITLDGADLISMVSFGAFGEGGDILLQANSLQLQNGAGLYIDTAGHGSAGAVDIYAEQMVVDDSIITAGVEIPTATGEGGHITINSSSLEIVNGGVLSAWSYGAGAGGDITVEADSITLDGLGTGAAIFATAGSSGSGGNILLSSSSLTLKNGGQISVSVRGQGDGGSLEVLADEITIDGSGSSEYWTGIFADIYEGATGLGGSIFLEAATIAVSGQGGITSESYSTPPAGTITITATDSVILDNGTISTQAHSAAGGDINLSSENLLFLIDSTITTSVLGGEGGGGDIHIDPIFVILNNSEIIAQADQGNGGNINIVADYFLAWPDATVSASSHTGIDGQVEIAAPTIDINSGLVVMPTYGEVETLSRDTCEVRDRETVSSLIVPGGGGFGDTPDGLRSWSAIIKH